MRIHQKGIALSRREARILYSNKSFPGDTPREELVERALKLLESLQSVRNYRQVVVLEQTRGEARYQSVSSLVGGEAGLLPQLLTFYEVSK